jgi:hypothetical protein
MINLKSIFGNLFDSGEIASDIHTKNFSEDMIVRITHYNTGGQYDTMLNLTEAAHTLFFGQITNKDVLLAIRISRTRSVDIVLGNFEKKVTVIGDTIGSKFEKGSAEFLEFFPYGINDYHKATKEKFPVLINRLLTAVNAHAASFTDEFVELIHKFKDEFDAARGVQLEKKEDVTAAVLTKAEARTALEIQMSRNILDLASEYILDPEKGIAFFNQNLLNPTHKNPQGGDATDQYVLGIPVGIKTMADFQLQNLPDYYLLISNTGPSTIFGYTCADNLGLPVPASPFKLEPGEARVFSYEDLGGLLYLFFYTDSADTDGEVTIDQVDAPVV